MAASIHTTIGGTFIQFYDDVEPMMAYWMNHDGYWAEMVLCRCFEENREHTQGTTGADYDSQVLEYIWDFDACSVFQNTTRPDCRWIKATYA